MTLKEFALKYRLRLNDRRIARRYRIRTSEEVVLGRFGEIANVGTEFHVRFLATPRNTVMTGALRARYRQAQSAGFVCKWKGDAESIFVFNPDDATQVARVVKLVGARYRRQSRPATPEVLERLRQARESRSPVEIVGKSHALETIAAQTTNG